MSCTKQCRPHYSLLIKVIKSAPPFISILTNATATLSPYASRHHQDYFYFLLVNHQLLFESKTNDRRLSPLAHHHVGRTAKPGSLTNAQPRRAGGKWKDTPQTGPSPFKEAAISERSSSGEQGPVHSPGGAEQAAGATMLLRRGGGRRRRTTERSPGPSGVSEQSQAARPRHAQFPAQLSLLALISAPSST